MRTNQLICYTKDVGERECYFNTNLNENCDNTLFFLQFLSQTPFNELDKWGVPFLCHKITYSKIKWGGTKIIIKNYASIQRVSERLS